MKKLLLEDIKRLRRLVLRNARPLDYTKWKYLFENGNVDDFLAVLEGYQNEDGGFGYNLECNNWNPNSSPFTTCYALDYMDIAGDCESEVKKRIVTGILKYLASGEFLLKDGWIGMQGIPSNNEYAHMPWFHYYEQRGKDPDIGVTKRLSDFILKYGIPNSDLFRKALKLKEMYKDSSKVLLCGVPDYDPVALKLEDYKPESWPFWIPAPVFFVDSPQSEYYDGLKEVVETNLDAMVDALHDTKEIDITSEEDLAEYEKNNPHPDGKKWCVTEQAIGNYYWGTHHIVYHMDLLRKFGRLDVALPLEGFK